MHSRASRPKHKSPLLHANATPDPQTSPTIFPFPSFLLAAGLAIATVLVYIRTTTYPFVNYDDNDYIYQHDRVMGGLTPANVWWSLHGVHASNWHPLTWLSHMLDWDLFGDNAGGHHLTSVLLHAATAVGLLFALWRLTGDLWPSAFVAAVFALHPLRVESVAWAAERKDILSGLFFVLALRAYAGYVEEPTAKRYLVVALLFVLGLMSKPMVITFPCVLLLLDYWPLCRLKSQEGTAAPPGRIRSGWQLFFEKIPLFGVAAVSALITMNAQTPALESGESITLGQRVPNAIVSYQDYIVQSLYPVEMAVFYPHPKGSLPTWKVAAASALLLSVSIFVILSRRRAPYLLVGWFWYLGMLIPVIGVIQVGWQARADRYMYLPQVGLIIAVAWGTKYVLRLPRSVVFVTTAMILGALAFQTWRQTANWRDSETLFRHALECTGPNAVAHSNLGSTLIRQGRRDEAMSHMRKALELAPDFSQAKFNLMGAFTEVGIEAAQRGDYDEAIAAFRTALEYGPSNAAVKRNLAIAYVSRGKSRLPQKRLAEAIVDFQQAVEVDTDFVPAYSALGDTLFDLGRDDEAIFAFRRILAINPKDTFAQQRLKYAVEKAKGGK